MNRLKFNKKTHTYEWRGVKIPSVTQIVKEVLTCGKNYYKDNGAREKGVLIHKLSVDVEKGKIDIDSIKEEYRGYLEAWLDFLYQYGINNIKEKDKMIEKKMMSRLMMIAGTPDRIYKRKDEIWIVDIKTGTDDEKMMRMQLVGYGLILEEKERGKDIRIMDVFLKENGEWKLKEYPYNDRNKKIFKSFVNVFYYKKK